MIKVRKALRKNGRSSCCSCCNTLINTTEIQFLDNGWGGGKTTIILCNDCIREMMMKLLEAKWSESDGESEEIDDYYKGAQEEC